MKQAEMTKKINHIVELIHLAEVNYCVARELYKNHIATDMPSQYSLIRLTANNAFNGTVLILNVLLVSKVKRELRVRPVLKQYDSTKLSELESIEEKFKQFDLHKVRGQSVAHKNDLLKDPAAESSQLLIDEYLERLGDILFELRNKLCEWFNYSKHNPSLSALDEIDSFPVETVRDHTLL